MKNVVQLFKRIRNIIVGNTLPKNEDLWLDTSNGEKNAVLKYKGNAINKGVEIEGVGDPSNNGKIVGYDAQGNLVPVNDASGATITGTEGQIVVCDDQGNGVGSEYLEIGDNGFVASCSMSVGNNLFVGSNMSVDGATTFSGDVTCNGSVLCNAVVGLDGGLTARDTVKVTSGGIECVGSDITVGDNANEGGIVLYDNYSNAYRITVAGGQLVVTQI